MRADHPIGKHRKVGLGLLMIGAAIVASSFLFLSDKWITWILSWVSSFGAKGVFLFGFLFIAATVVFVPSTPFILGAGFLYSLVVGSALASIASTISATISFFAARYWARDWVARKLEGRARLLAFDSALQKNGFKMVFLMRLQPVFVPFVYLNMGLGITRVSARDYILGSWLGMLPGTILCVYFGSLIRNISELSGHHATSAVMAPVLLWTGFAVTVIFLVMVTRMAKASLQSVMESH